MGNRGGSFWTLSSRLSILSRTRIQAQFYYALYLFTDDSAAGVESPFGEAVMTDVTRAISQSMIQFN
ncbi:unnamed protein product [Fusarium graminearum]|uniref:Chromosome 3, complete genome n=1 Tax=Gibberella zeae (strain ATCC MYA-4620 / CBS 123657 / FGSC 9075 / NRRL 31084 / PH-1) TaxID=229533 RepID=A0A098DXK8_GIBZE|nr:unnamed protein product [Fusarium graminearum]CZS83766.1 unnamed protein product [Fusarium graminearum]